MKYERLIILNYIKSFFDSKDTSVTAIISIISITISVFSLMMVLSVMKGFDVKVKEKIFKSFPHIIIKSDKKIDLNQFSEVKSYQVTSETYGGMILRRDIKLLQIKSVNEAFFIKNTDSSLREDFKSQKNIPVLLDSKLASSYQLDLNDKVNIVIPDFTKKEPTIRELKTTIVGIFDSKASQVHRIYVENRIQSKIFSKDKAFIEVILNNPYQSKEIKQKIVNKYDELKYKIFDWQSINSSLFNLMKLERYSLIIFLGFLILISATTIYSNITTFITQKRKEIGTLILLGSSRKSLILIFSSVGVLVGGVGIIFGSALSLISIYIIQNTGFINSLSLDIAFYEIDGFPIIFSIKYFLNIFIFSFLMILASSFIPSYLILNKDPELLIKGGN